MSFKRNFRRSRYCRNYESEKARARYTIIILIVLKTQLWQWIKHKAVTKEGNAITYESVKRQIEDLIQHKKSQLSSTEWNARQFNLAQKLSLQLMDVTKFYDFMPSLLYSAIVTKKSKL